jgi:hypothetical protein
MTDTAKPPAKEDIEHLPRLERWLFRRHQLHCDYSRSLEDNPEQFWRTRLRRYRKAALADLKRVEEFERQLAGWAEAHPRREDVRRVRERASDLAALLRDAERDAAKLQKQAVPFAEVRAEALFENIWQLGNALMMIGEDNAYRLEWLRNGIYPAYMLVVAESDLDLVAGIRNDNAELLMLYERYLRRWARGPAGDRRTAKRMEKEIAMLKKELREMSRLISFARPGAMKRTPLWSL